MKYNILSKKNFTVSDIETYLDDNSFYDCYYKSIKYINIKLRCEKELVLYLKKSFSPCLIEKVLSRLKKEGYLNDSIYVKSYINDKINLKDDGPLKIEKDLLSLGFSKELIDSNISIFSNELERVKINKIINKYVTRNKDKSSYYMRQKLYNNLLMKGYHSYLIRESLENTSICDDEIYEREYKKLYDKYKDKYSEEKLDFLIKSKLYQKGFRK